MNNFLNQIKEMHKKFKITSDAIKFSEQEKKFRIAAMQEELNEYIDAKTKEDELDALIDLIIFALGTVERQGMINVLEEAFQRVMKANMQKNIGTNKKRNDFQLDLIKPAGWKAPNLKDLVDWKEKYDKFNR